MFSKQPYFHLFFLIFLYFTTLKTIKSQNLVWKELVPHPESRSLILHKFTLNDTLYYYHVYDDSIIFWIYDEISKNWDTHFSIPTDTIIDGQYLFTIKDKIYHGLGYSPVFEDIVTPNLKVWEIDINKREIKQLKESPFWTGYNSTRSKGTIQNKGYICGGQSGPFAIGDDYLNCYDGCWFGQFMLYDPEADNWIRKKDLPEIVLDERLNLRGRHDEKTFVIDDELYMMGGEMYNNWEIEDYYVKDLWKYDFSQDNWIEIKDAPPTYAIYGIGGNLDNMGYVGLGYEELPAYNEPLGNISNKMYLYHPSTGWFETTSLPESMKDNYGFEIKGNSVGYLQTRNKLWKFSLEKPLSSRIKIYPNPVHNELHLEDFNSQVRIVIYNTKGKTLYRNENRDQKISIDLSPIEAQVLIVQLIEDHSFSYHKIIKL